MRGRPIWDHTVAIRLQRFSICPGCERRHIFLSLVAGCEGLVPSIAGVVGLSGHDIGVRLRRFGR